MAEAQSRDEVLEKVAVLEDPLKAAILTLLMRRPASIAEVASELDLPIGRARYQLRRLHQAGMVELTEVRPRRGVVERVYRRQPSIVSAEREHEHLTRREEGPQGVRIVVSGLHDGGFDRAAAGLELAGDVTHQAPLTRGSSTA